MNSAVSSHIFADLQREALDIGYVGFPSDSRRIPVGFPSDSRRIPVGYVGRTTEWLKILAMGPLFEQPAGPEGLLSEAAWPSRRCSDTCVEYS